MIQTNTKETAGDDDVFSPYESACILYLRSAFNLAPFCAENNTDAIAVVKANAALIMRHRLTEVRQIL